MMYCIDCEVPLRSPLPAMIEDGDWRVVCVKCQRRWERQAAPIKCEWCGAIGDPQSIKEHVEYNHEDSHDEWEGGL